VLVVAAVSTAVALLARRWPHLEPHATRPASRWAGRRDPAAATGLALLLAFAVMIAGGVVVGVLALVLRGDPDAIGLDAIAAQWAFEHATPFTTSVLEHVTNVGQPRSIIALAVVLGIVATIRTRCRWIVPFLVVVVSGNGFATTTIKHLTDRVRPSLNPAAEALGPSFPSGHSSWSAAFFAAAALVLARNASRRVRIALAATAAGLATAIAATRVLLDVHWVSDVVAGLALGWAWFAVCAIAFGGRLLRAGPAETAPRAAAAGSGSRKRPSAAAR
jgi:membrane-associated phospholipid phosphatase